MFYILVNIFRLFKIKIRAFGKSYHNHIFFHYYNDFIKLLQSFLVILLCWWKRYSIFLILFYNLFELFPGFIRHYNIGNLVNSLFGLTIFNPFPSFTCSSSPSSGGKSSKFFSLYFFIVIFIKCEIRMIIFGVYSTSFCIW